MIQYQYNYNNPGKSILIIGGLHGNEHTSVYAVQLFNKAIRNKVFKKLNKITICNFVNYVGIFNNTRQNQDGIDLNRQFHGNKSNKDIEKIKKLINQHDVIIDMHSSFNTINFCYLAKDKYTKSYINFLEKININYVVNYSSEPTMKNFINLNTNKIGFTIQLNQNNNDIDINSAFNGVQILNNIIKNIDLCIKKSDIFNDIEESYDITAYITGKMKIQAVLGKKYKKGQTIGRIQSIDGKNIISITIPEDGIIVAYPIKQAYVAVGQPIIKIQRINN